MGEKQGNRLQTVGAKENKKQRKMQKRQCVQCAVCNVTCLGLPLAGAGPRSRSGLLGVGPFNLCTIGLLVPE